MYESHLLHRHQILHHKTGKLLLRRLFCRKAGTSLAIFSLHGHLAGSTEHHCRKDSSFFLSIFALPYPPCQLFVNRSQLHRFDSRPVTRVIAPVLLKQTQQEVRRRGSSCPFAPGHQWIASIIKPGFGTFQSFANSTLLCFHKRSHPDSYRDRVRLLFAGSRRINDYSV